MYNSLRRTTNIILMSLLMGCYTQIRPPEEEGCIKKPEGEKDLEEVMIETETKGKSVIVIRINRRNPYNHRLRPFGDSDGDGIPNYRDLRPYHPDLWQRSYNFPKLKQPKKKFEPFYSQKKIEKTKTEKEEVREEKRKEQKKRKGMR